MPVTAIRAFQPIDAQDLRAVTASERIRGALRRSIVGMRFLPGEPLIEKELCETFGVSRTPLREALLGLAGEQLVIIRPQVGTFVAKISLPAVRDAMVIRQALERVSARKAAERATPRDIDALNKILAEQIRHAGAEGFVLFHEADESFHEMIATISGHPNLWRVVRQEKAQVDRGRLLTLPQIRRRRTVVAQHRRIVEAIAAADCERAERAMDEHLKDVLPSFAQISKDYPEYFEDEREPGTVPMRRAGRL